ncbi:uncharacterized protein LOC111878715 [Lactuca sativa]|uniref:Myb-like domain-containing protein n=1 Tax=Lactuca sativa TaxID=4236 RepID=A0A9R1VN33_LACSA|nr:uncharacterized protein LOC111878715 [Lactuca sativa]KAJ0207623.1 hypothetical protein LSAT_V11C500293330 [Lactuca sativa]
MSTNGATTTNNNKCSNGVMGSSEHGLLHNVLISTEWTSVEQSLLEELLVKYASDRRELCYRKISKELQDKTSRDVACRCQWMTKKEIGKRRKDEEGSSRKQNNRKEKTTDQQVKPSSHASNHANGLPSSSSSINNDDGINYKVIDGEIGKLLEQNAMALHQISVNFTTLKLHENINLFRQVRNNIDKISNEVKDMPEVMKRMPPLPVKLNEELANSILYRTQS